jgi:hypothetical protein
MLMPDSPLQRFRLNLLGVHNGQKDFKFSLGDSDEQPRLIQVQDFCTWLS